MSGQEMFALDDLARLFELTVREDTAAGGLTVTVAQPDHRPVAGPEPRLGRRPAHLAAGRAGARRPGVVRARRLRPARARARRSARALELRKPSRLILVGDIRVPRVAGRIEPLGSLARLTLDVAPATPHTVTQDGQRLIVRFEADTLDAALPATTATRSRSRPSGPAKGRRSSPSISARASRRSACLGPAGPDRGAGRIVIDVIGADRAGAPASPCRRNRRSRRRCSNLAPAGGLRTIVVDAGHGGTEEGAKGSGGHARKACDARRRAAAEGGARSAARRSA